MCEGVRNPPPTKDDSPKGAPVDLLREHITSRKNWGAYVGLASEVHRSVGADADEFLAHIRARLDRALGRDEEDND